MPGVSASRRHSISEITSLLQTSVYPCLGRMYWHMPCAQSSGLRTSWVARARRLQSFWLHFALLKPPTCSHFCLRKLRLSCNSAFFFWFYGHRFDDKILSSLWWLHLSVWHAVNILGALINTAPPSSFCVFFFFSKLLALKYAASQAKER